MSNLRDVSFPKCSKSCPVFRHMGKYECMNECPWKFDNRGRPVELKKEEKSEQKTY